MPLDPKQQPPYYTPGTPGTINNKYTRLNAQYTAVQTSGTTETDLYTYTLPANSLTTNGDGILITFCTQAPDSTVNNTLRFYFNAVQQFTDTIDTGEAIITHKLEILRISTTEVKITTHQVYASGTNFTQIQTVNSLDFTNTIPIKFTGQCPNPGQLQTYFMTIDKITL